jgi:hypothetical protein
MVSLVAAAFVFGPALAWSLGVTPKAIENRDLAPAPAAGQGWKAFDALSPWATDHLPGRAKAVHLNAWLEYNMLRQVPASQRSGPGGAASTPAVVRGKDGYLFTGKDFTNACSQAARYEQSLTSLARLAEIIEDSGRRVVFTVAPNKSSVTTDDLPRAVPRGACALRAIERQSELIDGIRHPLYVGVRKPLADAHGAGRQVFFRTDTHWTMLGGAMYAQALAARLDPELAPRLRLEPVRHTRVGDLTKLIGLTSPESVTSATLSSGATVFPGHKEAAKGARPAYQPESWVTRPGKGLVQGRTLLLGDSFTGAALTSLRPMFAQGRFVVFRLVPQEQLISEIRSADTVVIEVIERDIGIQVPTQAKFQSRVAAALGVPAG